MLRAFSITMPSLLGLGLRSRATGDEKLCLFFFARRAFVAQKTVNATSPVSHLNSEIISKSSDRGVL